MIARILPSLAWRVVANDNATPIPPSGERESHKRSDGQARQRRKRQQKAEVPRGAGKEHRTAGDAANGEADVNVDTKDDHVTPSRR